MRVAGQRSKETPAPPKQGQDGEGDRDARAFGGWVRVDTDHVLRGWATDRDDRDFRPMVEVLIDGAVVAVLPADRLDPRLVELGEGDGRYAFSLVLPAHVRDGAAHEFQARVQGTAHLLRSKSSSFEVSAEAPAPVIEIVRVGYGAVQGRIHGAAVGRSFGLELWDGDRRLEAPVEVAWSQGQGWTGFNASFSSEVQDEAGDDLVIAAPGMVEAGAGASIPLDLGLEAEHDETGLVVVRLTGDITVLRGRSLELNIYPVGEADPVASQPLSAPEPELKLLIDPRLAPHGFTVRMALDGVEGLRLQADSRRLPGRLVRNGAFSDWDAQGPRGWSAGPDGSLDRGFYAFPDRVKEAQGVEGDIVHIEAPASDQLRVLMVQDAPAPAEGDQIEAAMMVRTSSPTTVRLRLTDGEGGEVASAAVATRRAWTWTYAAELLAIARTVAAVRVEIAVEAGEALGLDIAGVRIGGATFSEPAHEFMAAEPVANAVENPDLADWPHGVVMSCTAGRQETARGWFVLNRKTREPVLVRALVGDGEAEGVGFLMAAPVVPDYCRLEVRLDPDAVERLGTVNVSFDAGSTAAARRLLGETPAGAPEHLLIERILVLKRSQVAAERGFTLVDDTQAVVARKVLVTRRPHRFSFDAALSSSRKASEFDWEEERAEAVEYFLAFEFRRPFALSVRNLTVGSAAAAAPEPETGFLMLEDRSIAVQAEQVRGLSLWLSPAPVTAEQVMAGAPPPAAEPLRWSWAARPQATVEVVICVYNAVEETLACLRSLIGSTTIPHTVRLIDDGSAPQVTARIEAFIADKPWMRLVRNPENLGYTYSADRGVREAEADWVILLNSDTVVSPGWIEGMLEAAASDPGVAFVGPLSNAATFQSVPELYDAKSQFKINDLPAGWTPAQMAALVAATSEKAFPETPLLNGFCTLMKRDAFVELGGLNRAAFPAGYGEENDLCTRAVKAGYKLVVADQVYVYHVKSASFGSARRQELAKAGSRALKELHPDVDYAALTAGFRDTPALVRLRDTLRDRLALTN